MISFKPDPLLYRRERGLAQLQNIPLPRYPAPLSPGKWFDLEFNLAGRNITAVVAGVHLPTYSVPDDRGWPLIRAWGGKVSIRGFTIHSIT